VYNKQFSHTRTTGLGHVAKSHPVIAGVLGALWLEAVSKP
jgi:hypothetical protein